MILLLRAGAMASSAAKSDAKIKRITEAKCNEWIVSPLINPLTGAAIAENGPTYTKIKDRCFERYNVRLPGANYDEAVASSSSNSAPSSAAAATTSATATAPPVPLTEAQSQELALIQEEFKRWNAFLYANTFRVGNWFDGIAANYMIMARKASRLGIPRVEILKMSRVPKRPGQKLNKSDKWGKWRESLIEMSLDVEAAGQESPEYTEFRNILRTSGGDIRAAVLYGIEHALELNSMYDEYQIYQLITPIMPTVSLPQFKTTYNEIYREATDNNENFDIEVPDTEGIYKLVHATFNLTDLQKYNAVLYVLREQYDDDANMEEFMKGRHFSEKSDERMFINSLHYKRFELRKNAIKDLLRDVLFASPLPSDEKVADLDNFLSNLNDNHLRHQHREFISQYSRLFHDIKDFLIPDIREELTHLAARENAELPESVEASASHSPSSRSLSRDKAHHPSLPPLASLEGNNKSRAALLSELEAQCSETQDLSLTEFGKMSKRDLQLIVKLTTNRKDDKKSCYTIRDIYKLWVEAVKISNPPKDIYTNTTIPQEKLIEILQKIKYISNDAPDPRTLASRPSSGFQLQVTAETHDGIHFNHLKAIRKFGFDGRYSVQIADLYYIPSELEPEDFRDKRGHTTQELSSAVLMANIQDLFEKGGLLTSNVPPYGARRILNKPLGWWTDPTGPSDRLIKGVSRMKFYEVFNEILEGLDKPKLRVPHHKRRTAAKSSSDEYR
jgi:hypothetical protein